MSAKSCPQCGRFFASVRCPHCGFTGRDEDFVRGCPVCGYSTPPGGAFAEAAPRKPGRGKAGRSPRRGEEGGGLSIWTYLLAALILICVLMLLYNSLR
jgi:ssDNA-binding Zn-finger/Zn-ribbon topoisomerase 1